MLDREGPLSPRIATRIIRHTLRGLVSAHGAKIVHRDIKPDNLVRADLPDKSMLLIKLIDFGIAKSVCEDTTNICRTQQVGTGP